MRDKATKETVARLKAYAECFRKKTGCTPIEECNKDLCDGCTLNYAQGTAGEHLKDIETAIKVLEKEPCEDAVSRADILEEIEKLRMSSGVTNQSTWNECVDVILSTVKNKDWLPSVQPTLIKASDIQPDDEWMQEDEWDEIYKKEENINADSN